MTPLENVNDLLNVEQSIGVRRLSPRNAVFTPSGGFAALDVEGEHYDRVVVCRAFPFTEPDRWLSVRPADDVKHEIGLIERPGEFDEATRALLDEQLALRYFTPKILRIRSAVDKHGFSTIDADTDRGRCKFSFRGGSDAVTRLSETRVIFTDLDGDRYEIPDVTKLTRREQKKIDVYL